MTLQRSGAARGGPAGGAAERRRRGAAAWRTKPISLRPRLDAAPAFAFALEGIVERMRQAAAGLQRGETGESVQQAEQAALARLEQMLAALKPDESAGGQDMPPPNQEQNPPMAQPPPGDLAGAMAELKLLKLLQEEINRRTAELEDSRAKTGQLTPADEEELAALAREQGRLADMVYNLIEATTPRPEDNPDALPEPLPQEKPPAEPKLEEAAMRTVIAHLADRDTGDWCLSIIRPGCKAAAVQAKRIRSISSCSTTSIATAEGSAWRGEICSGW